MMQDPCTQRLLADFRHELERFYAALKLAPPYDSVEKAVARLRLNLTNMDPDARARVESDAALRWEHYARAFAESGLHLKHRGPILGLLRSGDTAHLPPAHHHFLRAYQSQ
jgi:hypothetical protein